MAAATDNGKSKGLVYASLFIGTVSSLWAGAAFLSGLAQVNWQFSELLRQYLVAIGVMQEFHTFVDFYTHVKGVEYLICASFLSLFPVAYSYMNKGTANAKAS